MFTFIRYKCVYFLRALTLLLIVSLAIFTVPPSIYAQNTINLLGVTKPFSGIALKGLKFSFDNPLNLEFVVDEGSTTFNDQAFKEENEKLVKYFLSALTLPADDLWVNLSPYEKERIVPQELGLTDMGQELLSQDYILKQLSASLTYPESPAGKKYWDEIQGRGLIHQTRDTTGMINHAPTNNFQKIWIVPDKAVVYDAGNCAYVKTSRLKVMIEEDYLAAQKSGDSALLSSLQTFYQILGLTRHHLIITAET